MRVVIGAFAWLWVCFTASELYAAPPVSISAKLEGTLAGRIVVRRLAGYVGKQVVYYPSKPPRLVPLPFQEDKRLSGIIEQIIVPDIADYNGDSSRVRFKAKLTNIVGDTGPGKPPDVVELKELDIFGRSGVGQHQLLASELLGEGFRLARLLAEYKDDNGDVFWEALVELKDGEEVEPHVVLLNAKDDFMVITAPPPGEL